MGFTLIGYREGEAPRDAKGQTLTRRAILNASDNNETTISALAYMASLGVVEGAAHPLNTFAQAINLTPSREERSQRVFYVDINYATNALRTNNPVAERDNPLIRPSRRSFSTSTLSRTVTHSPISGAPFVNSADVITPVDWEFNYWVLTITRNETINTVAHYANYHNTIDNAGGENTGLLGAYPGEILLKIVRGEDHYESGLWYMEVNYELHAMPRVFLPSCFITVDDQIPATGVRVPCPIYNANGSVKNYDPITTKNINGSPTAAYVSNFDRIELQQGFSYWHVTDEGPPVVSQLIEFKNDNGEISTEPQLLNTWGGRLLNQGERLSDDDEDGPANPVYRVYYGHRRTNFADLNLLAV